MPEVIMGETHVTLVVNSDGSINTKALGTTSGGSLLPLKVVDDGSGLGKTVAVQE